MAAMMRMQRHVSCSGWLALTCSTTKQGGEAYAWKYSDMPWHRVRLLLTKKKDQL